MGSEELSKTSAKALPENTEVYSQRDKMNSWSMQTADSLQGQQPLCMN